MLRLDEAGVMAEREALRIRERLLPTNMFRNEKDQQATYFEGIFALPAGHVLTVDPSTVRSWRYWNLEPPAELRFHRVGGGEHRGEHAGEDDEREQESADHRRRVQGTAVRRRGPGLE